MQNLGIWGLMGAGAKIRRRNCQWVFRPAGATHCSDVCEIWYGEVRSTVPNITFIGTEMWEYRPLTVKI